MNKRMQQLVDQATTQIDPIAHDGVCWDFDKEKFAELIVRECAHQAEIWDSEPLSGNSIAYEIRKYFGVEHE